MNKLKHYYVISKYSLVNLIKHTIKIGYSTLIVVLILKLLGVI